MPFQRISSNDQAVVIPDFYAFGWFKPTPSIKPRLFVGLTKNRSAGFHFIIFTKKNYLILSQIPQPSIEFNW